jgi:SAM-dependent methyltransferase
MGINPLSRRPTRSWRSIALRLYREWRLWIEPERLLLRRSVREWLKDSPAGAKVLEVGAGTAFMEPILRRDIPDVLYINGDIAPTEKSAIVLDAAALPIADQSVDVVMALEVLEHMSAPHDLLAEAARVLRPSGRLVLTVPFMFGVHDFRDYYRYTPLGLETMLGEVGMKVSETILRGGTFVSATGLVRNLILRAIVGRPTDWRARGRGKQVRWIVAPAILTPWTLVTYAAYALDAVLDRESMSPPGYFFLCTHSDSSRPASDGR